MNKTQTLLLLALAEKLEKIENSKELAVESLRSAGILNENGKVTKYFPNLERVLAVAEQMYSSRSNVIIGFHGCDESVVHELLTKPKTVKISEKPFDWLGHGFYIWENNYDRALEWAKDKEKRGEIKKASVIGVVFTLDYCLDLIDSEFINILTHYYGLMENDFENLGNTLPQNKDVREDGHKDLLIRELDCAVIQYLHDKIKKEVLSNKTSLIKEFDSARGVFTEGGPAFPGAGIQKKSHIQICIRNMDCIKGFFLPRK